MTSQTVDRSNSDVPIWRYRVDKDRNYIIRGNCEDLTDVFRLSSLDFSSHCTVTVDCRAIVKYILPQSFNNFLVLDFVC